MFLKHLEIKNIRSIGLYENTFSKGINLIYGKNGVGKTTILEAIHTLSISKSFRKGYRKNIQKINTKNMSIVGEIGGEKTKRIIFRKTKEARKIKINDMEIKKISDLIGEFPSVVLSPEDTDIVSGGNSARLVYLNKILSISNKQYLKNLTLFNKIIKIRNRCLEEKQPKNQIIVWDEKLHGLALKIWEERELFFIKFYKVFDFFWKEIGIFEKANIIYKSIEKQQKENYIQELAKKIDSDKEKGKTSIGPHKDKIRFTFGDFDIKNQASQGEKKIFLIILKIAEAEYLYKQTNKKPILLLDDLFAKLDRSRGEKVLKLINDKFQTFITTTDSAVESYFENFKSVNFLQLGKEKKLCSVA